MPKRRIFKLAAQQKLLPIYTDSLYLHSNGIYGTKLMLTHLFGSSFRVLRMAKLRGVNNQMNVMNFSTLRRFFPVSLELKCIVCFLFVHSIRKI